MVGQAPAGRPRDASRAPAARWVVAVLLSPACLALAVAMLYVSSRAVWIGPFDRSTIGWAVVFPLLLLTPGAAAVGGRVAGSSRATIAATALTAVSIGVLLVLEVLSLGRGSGCEPISGPLDNVRPALAIGLVGAGGFVASVALASWTLRTSITGAFGFGALGGVATCLMVLLVYVVNFPVMSCLWIP